MAAARKGEEATPAVPAPVALRPFMQFSRLPPKALVALRRTLDTDADFRARVADEVSEPAVGRAGWLYVCRPDGWEEELAALGRAAEEVEEQAGERRAETEARRRLAGAEAATRRAEQMAAGAQAEAARAMAALADERRARREAAEHAADLDLRLADAATGRELARRQASEAAVEVGRMRARVAELEARLRELETAPTRPESVEPAPAPPPAEHLAPVLDGTAAGRALTAAAAAAEALAQALAAAGAALAPPAPIEDPAPPPAASPPERPRRRPSPRRRPVPLPPGVLDDSSEAADHLIRVPGIAVLVDGYNVSQTGWPGLPIAEQRRRLVDALTELAARTGADVSVVFDGSDTAWPAPVATTARAVRVSFSPAGVEADDVVIERVAELAPLRPVVVVSSDRRVQDGARASGANVVSSAQLLAALRR